MVTTLIGPNHYLLRRRLAELTEDFVKQHGELALERIDAESATPAAVLEAVQSLPFLAERKMVVLRSGSANNNLSGQIEQIIDAAGSTTDLVFYEPSVDRRTAYFKVLKSRTQLEEFGELEPRQLAVWLRDEAKKNGGSLSQADASYLVDRTGTNQEMLASELEKLLLYVPSFCRENIDKLTVKNPQSKIFDLLDAAFGGNKKRALELYEEQRAQRVEPQAIMALIAWQLEIIVLAFLGKGRNPAEIAREAGVSPYPLQKAQRLAASLDHNKLSEMVAAAEDIDYKSKTSGLNLDEALKNYIVTL